jgi:hypothetical protein
MTGVTTDTGRGGGKEEREGRDRNREKIDKKKKIGQI